MKGISLWQPHASAMAVGSKLNETRHWSTNYRGTMVIHAAKRCRISELIHYGCCWNWIGALKPLGASFGKEWDILEALPFGALVAVGNLVDCRPTESLTNGELDVVRYPDGDTSKLYGWTERQMGNYELGRFAWIYEDMKMLPEPIPFKGMQGLFNVPDELLSGVI